MGKACKVCLETKDISEFYKHPGAADGHLGKCKECQKAASKRARDADPERYREYDRARGRLPHRVENAIAQSKKWRAADLRRAKCHRAVARALRNGDLSPQDCAVCGSPKAVAHHEDYDKPLDVVWLCQVHHKARHKEIREQGEGNEQKTNLPAGA